MFLVVNTTRQHLSLGDLKVVLTPSQSIDLDSIADRRIVESSPSVKKAIVAGYLRVVSKDEGRDRRQIFDLDAIRDIVRQEAAGKDMTEIVQSILELKKMISNIPAPQVVNVVAGSNPHAVEPSILASEPQAENLVAIHERVVSRMSANVSSNISGSAGTSADAGEMKKKLDELEGLI